MYGHVEQFLKQIADDNNVKIMEMDSDKDHVHLLIECTPQHYIPNIVKAFKGVSVCYNLKVYKFRIYPNQEHEILIAKTIDCSRFVYNHFLNLWNHEYTTTGKGLSYNSCSAMRPQMKRNSETIWLKEVDSIAVQSSLKNLSDSFSRFFKKKNRWPQFKSKNNPIQSYATKNVNNSIEIRNNFVKLPKLGLVKFA